MYIKGGTVQPTTEMSWRTLAIAQLRNDAVLSRSRDPEKRKEWEGGLVKPESSAG